jgi:MFS family permease
MLFASLWNMHIMSSYGAFMINRIIQGIGWGTFEALVTGSISDIFFARNPL